MGPFDRNVEHLSGQHIGSAYAARDHGRSGPVGARVRPLGPAQAEFHDTVPSGGIADPGRLGGDQALVVDDIEQGGLHQLGLHDRSYHLHQWLPGEHHRPLRDRVDVAGKAEVAQIL